MASFSQSFYVLAVLIILASWTSRGIMSRKLVELEACSRERHEQWMIQHGKNYINDAEKEKRYQIYRENVEFIESFNANQNETFKLGVNQFADQTFEEFKSSALNGNKGSLDLLETELETTFKYENVTEIPETMDWRQRGAVTPIKDQNACGSCWAFATVAITESIHQITTGKLESLSEQELVDCVRGKTDGCNGGYMEDAFKFILSKKGIASEAKYPYKGVDRTCNSKNASNSVVASIKGFGMVPKNSETALLKAVANQPVGVYIKASQRPFQFYSGGVFTGKCGPTADHAVAIVGYGSTKDGIKYWIIKNSWGTNWGEKGYMRMKRDINSKKGLCGLAKKPVYPIA